MGVTMTEQEIREGLRCLAPFHHNVELPYGLRTHIPGLSRRKLEYTRLASLVKHAFPSLLQLCGGSLQGRRVLDVGCNCGGFSVEAAQRGAEYVLGIDVVDRYLEQAEFIKRALGLRQIEFKKMAVEDLDESIVGEYDITFCFGLLYHLENPVSSMKKLSSVTRRIMVVDTSVARFPLTRRPVWIMNFPPAAGLEPEAISTSLWRTKRNCQFLPNARAVTELLKLLGFSKVTRLKPTKRGIGKRYYMGKRATFLAVRD
jgi:SAM-dependent methyltransferase